MNSYFQTPPVVKNLIIINALVYMATALIQPAHNAIMEYCALWLGAPLFHTYQFVTYMFVHANFEHIFFNMFARPIFGTNITRQVLNWAISPSKTKMRIVINLMSLVIKPRSSIPLKSIPVC